MIEIEEMNEADAREALGRIGYAHLACCRENIPYVVPVHYAFDGEDLFVYTTDGKKAEIIRENPEICLQAEEVQDNEHWTSVMVTGQAEQIADIAEREPAIEKVMKVNPKLTPAVSIRWMDEWVRENIEVVLRIKPRLITGRRTVARTRPAKH